MGSNNIAEIGIMGNDASRTWKASRWKLDHDMFMTPSWFKSRLSNPNWMRLDLEHRQVGLIRVPLHTTTNQRNVEQRTREQEQGERRQ